MTLRAYDSRTRRHRSALQGRLAPTKAVLARVLFMRFFCFTRSCASASTNRVSRNRPAIPYTLTRLKSRRPKFLIAVQTMSNSSAVRISTLEPFNLFESLSNRMRDPTKNLFYLPLYCVAHQCRGVSKSDDLPPHPAFQNATPRRLPVTTPFVSLIVTPFQLTIAHHGAAVSEVWGLVSLSLRRPSRSGDASTMEYCSGIQVWDN